MVFKGYPEKAVHGLKVDTEIPRAYYICPRCEVGVCPPWSDVFDRGGTVGVKGWCRR